MPRYYYASSDRAFGSTSQLRDELLASYPGAHYLGAPIVLINRDQEAPAWGWVQELLRTRSDWWPALGVALQHAANDGGDYARIALADTLEGFQESVVLLDWTAPLAARWPNVKARSAGTTFGSPDYLLGTIVKGQRKLVEQANAGPISVGGLSADIKSQADLEALLVKSAEAGTTGREDGPWGFLLSELLFRPELREWAQSAIEKLGSQNHYAAALDWFSLQHDLWRYLDLLEQWASTPPLWWDHPRDSPRADRNWRHPIRSIDWNAKTLGDVALAALTHARAQASSRPCNDLERLF